MIYLNSARCGRILFMAAVFMLVALPVREALAGKITIKNCSSMQTKEIIEVIRWGASNWSAFEATLESAADVNIKKCLKNRFKKNGKVVCMKKTKGMCKGNNGWASPFTKKCHICPVFLNNAGKMPKKVNRQACYFALVAHEWAHTCARTHKSVEKMDNAAFAFWKRKHPSVGISMRSCGMD